MGIGVIVLGILALGLVSYNVSQVIVPNIVYNLLNFIYRMLQL